MSSPSDHGSIEKQIERTVQQYDRLQGFFPRVDTRATFLFTLNVAMAGVTASNIASVVHNCLAMAISLRLIVALGGVIVCTLLVFTTHLKKPNRRSLIFFGDIVCRDADDYQAADQAESASDFLNDLRCQNWRSAQILSFKYRWVGRLSRPGPHHPAVAFVPRDLRRT